MRIALVLVLASCTSSRVQATEPKPTVPNAEARPIDKSANCLGLSSTNPGHAQVQLVASIDKRPIAAAFSRELPGFRCCYRQQQERDASAVGKAIVIITIEEGEVLRSAVETEGSLDRRMSNCVFAVAQQLTIPEWKRPKQPVAPVPRRRLGTNTPPSPKRLPSKIHVRYPLSFAP